MHRDAVGDVILILFGIYIWDFVTSLWFEYRLLTKKIRFRWPFVPYFLTRYFVLVYVILRATRIFIDLSTLPLCTRAALMSTSLFFGNLAIVFSTWNLLIRAVIIWGNHPVVTKLLLATGLLHFVLSLITAFVGRPPCAPLPLSAVSAMMFGTATATIELAILVLSLVGIKRASHHKESSLARLLKAQGAAYFAMVLLLHVSMVVVNYVQTGGAASMCVGAFGAIIGPALSCRLLTSTLTQKSQTDGGSETQMHRIECFETPEGRNQNPSTRMTTFIDIPKERSVC